MSDDQMVTIEVDGRKLEAKAGELLIEVTDAAGINIPRFCYHKKLSVSANCRMCLVEVSKVPKPIPACATTVNNGMQVFTRSPLALAAQKGTMEFLLINHPLDCPICDQGGECELQDVAVGYGSDVSRFVEGKRVIPERNIGPLIATDFTRCIHCTRCVRFGAEIAGIRELGATGRGEHMEIGTYVEKSIDSELSGNIIDVCPVGSLTSKPARYQARAWELVQREAVAPHDSVGSNLHIHLRRNQVMRVHPKDNESVNECWISDRDRFSYLGLYSEDRVTRPLIKTEGQWKECDWQEALDFAAQGMKKARGGDGDQIGALVSPTATLEEMYLTRKLMGGLGSRNVDSRLRQGDFRGEESAPWLGQSIADLDNLNGVLLIGSNVRKEQPIFAHRLRKAAMEGAWVGFVTPFELDMNYRAEQLVSSPAGMISDLAAVAKALGLSGSLVDDAEVSDVHQRVAEKLKTAEKTTVLLGNLAVAHMDYSLLRHLGALIADATDSVLGFLPEAANSVGARLVGVAGGDGLDSLAMLNSPRKGYLLLGVEPDWDFWNPSLARQSLSEAEFVVALSAYRSASLEENADVILPVAGFTESSGTYVNAEGIWQSFNGSVKPMGEARPAWKVLRVLGNLLDVADFEYNSSSQVLEEARDSSTIQPGGNSSTPGELNVRTPAAGLVRAGDVPLYASDALVRRSNPLQKTNDAISAAVHVNPQVAKDGGFSAGDQVMVKQGNTGATMALVIDEAIPDGCARIPAALSGTGELGGQFGEVTLEKA
ncbi:MAG: NADH-quinone oxidoreductase subunit G [Gammaproteobacteria bacterium]|nr:NADH-quinone oxidoreductase subunit G [Gammaproteobacteria bacterium]